jgi:hypothetical protein
VSRKEKFPAERTRIDQYIEEAFFIVSHTHKRKRAIEQESKSKKEGDILLTSSSLLFFSRRYAEIKTI